MPKSSEIKKSSCSSPRVKISNLLDRELLKLPSYSVAAKQLLSVVVAENSISLIS